MARREESLMRRSLLEIFVPVTPRLSTQQHVINQSNPPWEPVKTLYSPRLRHHEALYTEPELFVVSYGGRMKERYKTTSHVHARTYIARWKSSLHLYYILHHSSCHPVASDISVTPSGPIRECIYLVCVHYAYLSPFHPWSCVVQRLSSTGYSSASPTNLKQARGKRCLQSSAPRWPIQKTPRS